MDEKRKFIHSLPEQTVHIPGLFITLHQLYSEYMKYFYIFSDFVMCKLRKTYLEKLFLNSFKEKILK